MIARFTLTGALRSERSQYPWKKRLRPSIQSENKTLVTLPVMNSRIANMSAHIHSGGKISNM